MAPLLPGVMLVLAATVRQFEVSSMSSGVFSPSRCVYLLFGFRVVRERGFPSENQNAGAASSLSKWRVLV